MIQAKELMLGNNIYYKWEIIVVRPNDIGLLDEYDRRGIVNISFEPIPITPELLEKAGFEIDEDNYAVWGDYRIYCSDGDIFYLQAYCGYNNEEVHWIQLPGKHQYFHQLQNVIFALTGEELQLKIG